MMTRWSTASKQGMFPEKYSVSDSTDNVESKLNVSGMIRSD